MSNKEARNCELLFIAFVMNMLKFKLKCMALHFGISVLVAACAAALTFFAWYPAPFHALLGVGPIFALAVLVDVVCGPVITAVIANPAKPRKEKWLDFGVVGTLQMVALLLAMHAVFVVRPVAVVFEVDRFVVVSANEVDVRQLPAVDAGVDRMPLFSRLQLGTKTSDKQEDVLQSVAQSLAGFGPATRPSWWLPYAAAKDQVASRMRSVSELLRARPASADLLQKAIRSTGLDADSLWFVPLTTSQTKDWVVLLNKQQDMLAYAPVDGFIAEPAAHAP